MTKPVEKKSNGNGGSNGTNAIKQLRQRLDMNGFVFAAALGVQPSTVVRWESPKATGAAKDMLQRDALAALQKHCASKSNEQVAALGKKIANALMIGGSLAGFKTILDEVGAAK